MTHVRLGGKRTGKKQQTSSIDAKSTNRLLKAVCRRYNTPTSTCLASSVRASSSPQIYLINRKCRKLPLSARTLKRESLPSNPFTATYRLHGSFCRPWTNMASLFRCPKMSARMQSRIWNWVSSLATGRSISSRKLLIWESSATNLSRTAPTTELCCKTEHRDILRQMWPCDSEIFGGSDHGREWDSLFQQQFA